MTSLDDLIERVEAATGPDRELDADIWEAVGLAPNLGNGPYNWKRFPSASYHQSDGNSQWGNNQQAPFYTASIDAAVGLIAPNCDWLINRRGNYACIWESKESDGDRRWEANAATIPLALLFAILRARKQMSE